MSQFNTQLEDQLRARVVSDIVTVVEKLEAFVSNQTVYPIKHVDYELMNLIVKIIGGNRVKSRYRLSPELSEVKKREVLFDVLNAGNDYKKRWNGWYWSTRPWLTRKPYLARESIRSRPVMEATVALIQRLQEDALRKGILREPIVEVEEVASKTKTRRK